MYLFVRRWLKSLLCGTPPLTVKRRTQHNKAAHNSFGSWTISPLNEKNFTVQLLLLFTGIFILHSSKKVTRFGITILNKMWCAPPPYLFVEILLRNVDGKGITGLYYANSICTCRSVKPLHTHTHYVHTYKKCVAETLKDDHSKNEQTRHSTPKPGACMPGLSLPVIRKVIKQTYMVIRSSKLKWYCREFSKLYGGCILVFPTLTWWFMCAK